MAKRERESYYLFLISMREKEDSEENVSQLNWEFDDSYFLAA